MNRIIISGGGTGGHISPALAVSESLRKLEPKIDIVYFSTPRPVDRRMYSAYGSSVKVLDPPRIDGGMINKLKFLFRFPSAFISTCGLLKELDPDLLFVTGGYSSFFPVLCAAFLRIPIVIHESNSIPGKSTRVLSKMSNCTMIGFESTARKLGGKTIHTGNPVRPSIKLPDRIEARRILDIPAESATVLFLGGSQGARAINDIALCAPGDISVILQCGERDSKRIVKASAEKKNIKVISFSDKPETLYSAADIIVARAGAMTIAEVSWFRIPAIYIPYPFAADDHQYFNAEEITNAGGSLLIRQEKAAPDEIWSMIRGLLENTKATDAMRMSLAKLMPTNPAGAIARYLLDMTNRNRGNK